MTSTGRPFHPSPYHGEAEAELIRSSERRVHIQPRPYLRDGPGHTGAHKQAPVPDDSSKSRTRSAPIWGLGAIRGIRTIHASA